MNFDPATSTLTLDLLATTGFGCVMVYLGKGIVRRVKAFQDWSLPAPVIGGLIVALILSFFKEQRNFHCSVDLHTQQPSDEPVLYLCWFRLQPYPAGPR